MITKILTGKSMRGLLRYLFREGEETADVELVGGNLVGYDIDLLARQFFQVRLQKPELTKPVTHLVLSFDPQDEARLSPERKLEAVERHLRNLGYLDGPSGDCPYVTVRHADKAHDHFHVAVCQISFSGQRVSRTNDKYRAQDLDREMEAEWGLRQCLPHAAKVAKKKAGTLSPGDFKLPQAGVLEDPGQLPQHEWLRQIIGPIIHDLSRNRESIAALAPRLLEYGLELVWKEHSKGLNLGVRIHAGAHAGGYASFSELKTSWSFSNLQKRWGLSWDSEKDLALLLKPRTVLTLDGLRQNYGLSPRIAGLRRQLAVHFENRIRRIYASKPGQTFTDPTGEHRSRRWALASRRTLAPQAWQLTEGLSLSDAGEMAGGPLQAGVFPLRLGRHERVGRLAGTASTNPEPGGIGSTAPGCLGGGLRRTARKVESGRGTPADGLPTREIPWPAPSFDMGVPLSDSLDRLAGIQGAADARLPATGDHPAGSNGPRALVPGHDHIPGNLGSGQHGRSQWAGDSTGPAAGGGSRLGSGEGGRRLDRYADGSHHEVHGWNAQTAPIRKQDDPQGFLMPSSAPQCGSIMEESGIMRRVTLADIVKGRAYHTRGPMRLVSRRSEKAESFAPSPWSLTYLIKPRMPKAVEPRLRFGIRFPDQTQGIEESSQQTKPGEITFAEPWRTFADRLREIGLDSMKIQNIIERCPLAPKEALRVLDSTAQEMGMNSQHHWLESSLTDSTWWHRAHSLIGIQTSEIPPAETPKMHRWK